MTQRDFDSNGSGSDVSVIVPTFNRAEMLREALESLVAQSVPAREIIVVDDGSADATPSVVKSFGEPVRYLRQANAGKATAFSRGLKHAMGGVIWVFDDDDVAQPTAIEDRLNAWSQDPGAGFVYGPHYVGDDDGSGALRVRRLNEVPEWSEGFFCDLLIGCFFHLNSCLVKKELFERLGAFDPLLKAGEDYDFQIRMARVARGVRSAKPVFNFRRHQGMRGSNSQRYRAADRARVFRDYDQAIGRKLRCSLGQLEFLRPDCRNELDATHVHRAAYLARMHVMASKGCFDEMLADLSKACSLSGGTVPLTVIERDLVSRSVLDGHAGGIFESHWRSVLSTVRGIENRGVRRAVVMALMRGSLRRAKSYPELPRDRLIALWSAVQLFLNQISRGSLSR